MPAEAGDLELYEPLAPGQPVGGRIADRLGEDAGRRIDRGGGSARCAGEDRCLVSRIERDLDRAVWLASTNSSRCQYRDV